MIVRIGAVAGFMFAVALAMFAPAPASAQASCPAIPEVPWWFHEPDKIIDEVNSSQGGDWAKYIERWERQREAMEEIAVSGRRAVVRSHNVTLEGASLREYIDKLDRRISSLKCLAQQNGSATKAPATARAPVGATGSSSPSASACPAVPYVEWWGDVTPETIKAAVKERFNGSWDAYTQRWLRELNSVTDQVAKNQPAMVNDLGLSLKGPDLDKYIANIANLMLTVRCLAGQRS